MASAFDSNIVLYAMTESAGEVDKAARSKALLQKGGIVSVQVLNEVAWVAFRKLSKTWPEINYALDLVRAFCDVVPVTIEVHDEGRYIAERYQLGVFDAMILAAAYSAKCDILYSEDMHDGLVVNEKLRVCNPFLHER